MRILLAAAALSLASPALADSYSNARYGYELVYPSGTFAPQPEADSGDGRHFKALGGHADLAVWASYNAMDQSADDIARDAARDCSRTQQPYRLVRPTVALVSCTTAAGILYHKTYIRGDVLTSFEITYPAWEKARWDVVIAKLKLYPAQPPLK